jgi:adenylate kinase family enzyme
MSHLPCDPLPSSAQRICVVGTTGCGKSTLADSLAHRLYIPHIELDAIYWKPGWEESDRKITRIRVKEIAFSDAWIMDGNYSFLRDILWPRAEALVWLDYPLGLIIWRLWWRTWKRTIKKELLWGTNTERLGAQFFNKDSLFLWALKSYGRNKKNYTTLPVHPEYAHLKVYRLRSPRETKEWLRYLLE